MSDASNSREYGGYLELETFRGSLYHDEAIALNTARNGLAYLIEARGIRSILLPEYLCDSVESVCTPRGVEVQYYPIGEDLRPAGLLHLKPNQWLYLVNYFGQLSSAEIAQHQVLTARLIVDNSQAFFSAPVTGVDTIYTCRKFFGVPDGAFLYTESCLGRELASSSSADRMSHILGRFEGLGSDHYGEYRDSERALIQAPIEAMSPVTSNLLRAVDYDAAAARRHANFKVLAEALDRHNLLQPTAAHSVPFAYPLLVEGGMQARARLHAQRVYVPTLWPNVIDGCPADTVASRLARDVLPIPLDQRYTEEDMARLVTLVEKAITE